MLRTGGVSVYPGCHDVTAPNCVEQVETIFRVDRVLKGELGKTVSIWHEPSSSMECGPAFGANEPVILGAHIDVDGRYAVTNMCFAGAKIAGLDRTKVLEALERYRHRLDALQAAIDLAPGDPDPVIDKARFLEETKNPTEALKLLSEVLVADPDNREAVLLTARLRSQRNEDELALAVLEPYLALNASDRYALRARVASLVRLGRVDEVQVGWRDFSKLRGQKLDLSDRAFDRASFQEAALKTVSFAGASLKQADFSEAQLWNVVLDGADLAGADLTDVLVQGSLDGVSFESAKLVRAAFGFRGRISSLKGADLAGADFRSDGLGSRAADFRSKRLRIGSLEKVNAVGVNAEGSRFLALKMAGADFSDSDLSGAQFLFLDLNGASFRGANLNGATFREADLTGADLKNANLHKASFKSSKLDGARLEGAVFDHWTTWPDGFDPIEAGARME